MSTVIAKNVQIGTSGTATDNFTIFQPATPDGTLRIGNGNTGITTSQVALTSAGNVGIGTSSPVTEFQLTKDQNSGTTIRVQNSTTGTAAFASLQLVPDTGGSLIAIANSTVSTAAALTGGASGAGLYTSSAMTGGLSVGTTAGPLKFFAGSTSIERARIDSTGARSTVIPSGSTLYPAFDCRAWVNFNGTGTVAIRGSGNVSSITDNGTGDYTVNFTTAMPDANYAANCSTVYNSTVRESVTFFVGTPSTTAIRLVTGYTYTAPGATDTAYLYVTVFR